jgi:hypothetical protein
MFRLLFSHLQVVVLCKLRSLLFAVCCFSFFLVLHLVLLLLWCVLFPLSWYTYTSYVSPRPVKGIGLHM